MWVAATLAIASRDESCLSTSRLSHIENVSVPNIKLLCCVKAGIISPHSTPFCTLYKVLRKSIFVPVWMNTSDQRRVESTFCRGNASQPVAGQSTPFVEGTPDWTAVCNTLSFISIFDCVKHLLALHCNTTVWLRSQTWNVTASP